jgi:hypothetical protein
VSDHGRQGADFRRKTAFGVGMGIATRITMARGTPENTLTSLWELADGTRACVIEHAFAPHWEVCLVRRDRVVQRHRCDSLEELMATSMGFHAVATQ